MKRYSKGFAALLTIFVLGMISLFIALSLVNSGYLESKTGRAFNESAKAYYFANAGIEDALYRINKYDFGNGAEGKYTIDFPDSGTSGKVEVTVKGDKTTRKITAVGYFNSHVNLLSTPTPFSDNKTYIRKINADIINTSVPGDAFNKTIHGGSKGVIMEGNSYITGLYGLGGDVYSNTNIVGKSSSHDASGKCLSSASRIDGKVWAAGGIDKTDPGTGICVEREIYARDLRYCNINSNANFYTLDSLNCNITGTKNTYSKPEDAPQPIELPNFGEETLKTILTEQIKSDPSKQKGTCIVDGSPGDCTGGTLKLGSVKIKGDLTIKNIPSIQPDLLVDGPIWVTGNLIINSNVVINLDPSVENHSQLWVVDGSIISDSNVTFGVNVSPKGKAYLLFISTQTPANPDLCSVPTITISSNAETVLFYAKNGCILVNSNSQFQGSILGEGIKIESNSTITYDPDIQAAIFETKKGGGWQILDFKEE